MSKPTYYLRQCLVPSGGLTDSEIGSLTSLLQQEIEGIESSIGSINNASKSIEKGGKFFTITKGIPIPENIKVVIERLSLLISLRDYLLNATKTKEYINEEDLRILFFS